MVPRSCGSAVSPWRCLATDGWAACCSHILFVQGAALLNYYAYLAQWSGAESWVQLLLTADPDGQGSGDTEGMGRSIPPTPMRKRASHSGNFLELDQDQQ